MNKKVVVLGGGSGLSNLLKGIKKINNIDITAIVTVADSGGSTGILSKQFKIPAVGDLRRVIAALSLNRKELEESMEYRFNNTGSELDGHTIGNLILTSQILMKNNFSLGVASACKMLNVHGTVLPVSNDFNHLTAIMKDGTLVKGEDKIGHTIDKIIEEVFYDENAKTTPDVVSALLNADYIIFGIGSLFTSLIANLVYKDIQKALKETSAEIIYFANVWTQHGETDGFTINDHISAIEKHLHKNVIDKVVISNTVISEESILTYKKDKQYLMDINNVNHDSVIFADLVSTFGNHNVKHDENKINHVLQKIFN